MNKFICFFIKVPKASNLSRKQTQAQNSPYGKQRCRGTSTHDPKVFKLIQWVKEYPDKSLSVSNDKLFEKGVKRNYVLRKAKQCD